MRGFSFILSQNIAMNIFEVKICLFSTFQETVGSHLKTETWRRAEGEMSVSIFSNLLFFEIQDKLLRLGERLEFGDNQIAVTRN